MIKSTAKLVYAYPCCLVLILRRSKHRSGNPGVYKIPILIPAAAAIPSNRAQSLQFGLTESFGNGFGTGTYTFFY